MVKKFLAMLIAVVMVISLSMVVSFAAEDNGKPVYIAVYGLNQLNRNCIWACSSSGYVDSVQIWDGGTCIKDGWLKPDHDYTIKVRVNGVTVALDGNRGVVYLNGADAWGGHGINPTDESQSYVTAKTTFHTTKYVFYPFPCYRWCWGWGC